jgi:membrane-associated phospholipid phosphatase
VLWLATRPGDERRWKIAALSGTATCLLALLINQIIGHLWHRPRPYQSHTGAYHLTNSHDPSFPSDHASAAFGIAFGIYVIDRRVGRFFVIVATLIAVGRVLVGAHYATDILASAVVATAAAIVVAQLGQPLLLRVARLLERISDPVVARLFDRGTRT